MYCKLDGMEAEILNQHHSSQHISQHRFYVTSVMETTIVHYDYRFPKMSCSCNASAKKLSNSKPDLPTPVTCKSGGRFLLQVTGHRSQVAGHRSQVTGQRIFPCSKIMFHCIILMENFIGMVSVLNGLKYSFHA